MAIQEFGNAFKAEINNNNRRDSLKAVGMAAGWTVVDTDFFVAPPGGVAFHNYGGGDSVVIDNFWAWFDTAGTGMRAAVGAAGTGGDDWQAADAVAGQKLGQLYNEGWEVVDFHRNVNDIAVWHPVTGAEILNVGAILVAGDKLALIATPAGDAATPWRTAFSTTPAGGVATARAITAVGTAGDGAKMDAWLTHRTAQNITPNHLTAAQAGRLYTQGWEATDIVNDTTGNIRALHPITGVNLDGFAAIDIDKLALIATPAGDAATPWRTAFSTTPAGGVATARAITAVGTAGDGAKMDAWLTHRTAQNITPNHLTAAQAGRLYTQGWEATDIVNDTTGNIRALHPITGVNLDGFAAIDIDKLALIATPAGDAATLWRTAFSTTPAGGVATARAITAVGTAGDGAKMDAWLTHRTAQNITPNHLTAAQAGRLYTQGWEATDIVNDTTGNIRALHPITGVNLDGFAAIDIDKLALIATPAGDAATPWRTAFSTTPAGGVATARAITAVGTAGDGAKMDAWLTHRTAQNITPNHLTAAQAGRLYTQGWEATDIVNDTTGNIRALHPITGVNLDGFAAIDIDKIDLITKAFDAAKAKLKTELAKVEATDTDAKLNLIIAGLTNEKFKVVEEAQALFAKCIEANGLTNKDDVVISELETFSKASAGTAKKEAWEAVNKYVVNSKGYAQAALDTLNGKQPKDKTAVEKVDDFSKKIAAVAENATSTTALDTLGNNMKATSEYIANKDGTKERVDNILKRAELCITLSNDTDTNKKKLGKLLLVDPKDSKLTTKDKAKLQESLTNLKNFTTGDQVAVYNALGEPQRKIIDGLVTELELRIKAMDQTQDDTPKGMGTLQIIGIVLLVGVILAAVAYFLWGNKDEGEDIEE